MQTLGARLPTTATINRELEALGHAYRQAQQDGLLPVVPNIQNGKENKVRTGFVADVKQDQVRSEAKELWLRSLLELGLS